MPWIDTIDETDASGDLKDAYEALDAQQKKIANILRVHSLNAGAMERQMSLYTHLMFGRSGLSRADRESIAVVVSAANNCGYCVSPSRGSTLPLRARQLPAPAHGLGFPVFGYA